MSLLNVPKYYTLSINSCKNTFGTPLRPYSALSAIHDGIRRTQNASRERRYDPAVAARLNERRKRRLEAPSPNLRIRKGKKDITQPLGPKRPTRAARFNDPTSSFGKRSLVYQLKSSGLVDDIKRLSERRRHQGDIQNDGRGRDERHRTQLLRPREDKESWGLFGHRLRTGRSDEGQAEGRMSQNEFRSSRRDELDSRRRPYRHKKREWLRGSRDADMESRRPCKPVDPFTSLERDSHEAVRDDAWLPQRRPTSRPASPSTVQPSPQIDTARAARMLSPVSMTYTTAASQFLYGQSVVEAAIRANRRRLYKLYVYGGANRQNAGRDHVIEKLAKGQGIETVTLYEHEQRLMDKMSQGRPYNGYILAASPLPQRPLSSLGGASPYWERPGFQVELAFQSGEDAAINGTADFVPTSPGQYKPLVLVLDQVLDPGNLGGILRPATCLGDSAVVISKTSAPLGAVALKASAGASENLTLFSVESPAQFLEQSKEAGWKVYAAVHPASCSRRKQVDLNDVEKLDPLAEDPCFLLVGSEGEGLSKALKTIVVFVLCFFFFLGSFVVVCLFVSVATALLCASFFKRRTKNSFLEETKDELSLW